MDKRLENFTDLNVYRTAFELQQRIFEITIRFPHEESYSLTDQIRRSTRSIGANIAEAWQKRRYPAHFISKLTDSQAEQAETQHWLVTCLECKYIKQSEYDELAKTCTRIGRMLGQMIKKANTFCRNEKVD